MNSIKFGKSVKTGLVIAGALLAAACESTPFDHVGKPPSMTAPGAPQDTVPPPDPVQVAIARPPMPVREDTAGTGSLWRSGPASLFGDRRARTIGDIVTVLIEIDDRAELRNRTNRTRSGNENLEIPAMFGLPGLAANALPGTQGINPAIDATSNSSTTGDGRVQREERITLRIAATVNRVLPNGHLMILGDQEVRVNNELRDLQVAGIIRPEDISRQNIITYDKIASARIAYGGRGQLTDLQQPRVGQQVLDIVSPF